MHLIDYFGFLNDSNGKRYARTIFPSEEIAIDDFRGETYAFAHANSMGSVDVSEESIIRHVYNFGDHRCKRGHSYRIKFETKDGYISGYFKVCRRCGHDQKRELNSKGNRIVDSEISMSSGDGVQLPRTSQSNVDSDKSHELPENKKKDSDIE